MHEDRDDDRVTASGGPNKALPKPNPVPAKRRTPVRPEKPPGRPGGGARHPFPGPRQPRPKRKRATKYVRGPHLVLRGLVWHIRGTFLEIRLRESTWETDLTRAQVVLGRRLAEEEKRYQGRKRPRKATYGEADEGRLKSLQKSGGISENSEAEAEKWLDLIGAATLCEEVTWSIVRKLAEERLRPTSKESTLKRTVATPKSVLTWAHGEFGLERGCPPPNFPNLKDGEPRHIYLSPVQVVFMHEQALKRARDEVCKRQGIIWQLVADVLVVGVGEGPRRGEFFNLEWEFINQLVGTATLRHVKSSKARVIDRNINDPRPRTMDTLRGIQARTGNTTGRVFLKPDGTPFASPGTFGAAINPRLRELAKECGHPDWEDVTLHVLRHTAATWAYILTGDIHHVETRFLWESSKSAKRYIQNAPRQLAPACAAFLGLQAVETRVEWR
jgi:integrase